MFAQAATKERAANTASFVLKDSTEILRKVILSACRVSAAETHAIQLPVAASNARETRKAGAVTSAKKDSMATHKAAVYPVSAGTKDQLTICVIHSTAAAHANQTLLASSANDVPLATQTLPCCVHHATAIWAQLINIAIRKAANANASQTLSVSVCKLEAKESVSC